MLVFHKWLLSLRSYQAGYAGECIKAMLPGEIK